MWSAACAYYAGMRDVIGLQLPEFEKYQAWEDCARLGGFRVLHEEFCIVSDFPELIRVDSRNRPHCEDGPSHRWRDGWELYHWHGTRVDPWIIMHPERITVEIIEAEENAEIRRILVQRYGMARYIQDTGAEEVDAALELGVRLLRKQIGADTILMLHMRNSTVEPDGTVREFFTRLHSELKPLPLPTLTGDQRDAWFAEQEPQELTARNAVASSFGLRGEQYAPAVMT